MSLYLTNGLRFCMSRGLGSFWILFTNTEYINVLLLLLNWWPSSIVSNLVVYSSTFTQTMLWKIEVYDEVKYFWFCVCVHFFVYLTWHNKRSVKFRGRSDIEWSSVVRLDLGRNSVETRLDLGDQLLTCRSHPSCSQLGNNLSCGRAPDNIPVFSTKHHLHWTIFGRSVRKLYLF